MKSSARPAILPAMNPLKFMPPCRGLFRDALRAGVVCAVFLLLTAPASAQERTGSGLPGSQAAATQRYVVTLRPEVAVRSVTGELKLKTTHTYQHALRGFAAELDAGQVAELKNRGDVLAVELDGMAELCTQTIGAGIIRMGLTNYPFARINGMDERIDVDVAVIDTGIQANHPDLNVFRAVDVTGTSTNGNDLNGHGTHVAGIVGALDNDFGVVGVAPGARLWSVRISRGAASVFDWSDTLAGFDYVAQHTDEIEVVNCSFVNGELNAPAVAIRQAVSNLVKQGVVVVAATGNSISDIIGRDRKWGSGDDFYPAALREVMAVSNVDPSTDTFSLTSCYSSYERPGNFVVSSGGRMSAGARFTTNLVRGIK